MRSYSLDLRQRVMAALEKGDSSLEVAARFGVSDSWVRKLRIQYRETGEIGPKPHAGGWPLAIDEKGEEILRELIVEKNDSTLKELRDELANRYKEVGITTVWRAIERLGLTYKKKI